LNDVRQAVDDAYRREWTQVLATTVRVTGDLDVAEECVQEAFVAALDKWSKDGVPDKPGAWLTTTARRKALDQVRRDSTLRSKLPLLLEPEAVAEAGADEGDGASVIGDDRLRLVFTCCHPSLASETQIALTLRLVCGLPTEDIARTFLVSESTMAARITRGKKKIQVARIPFAMPQEEDLAGRLDAVLTVIHLFYTAGHTATIGSSLVNDEVARRAIDLARLLYVLMPDRGEVEGLLALLLLTNARRESRLDTEGNLVLLSEQDRSKWDRTSLSEGLRFAGQALSRPEPLGRYALQAAIAAVHARAANADATDWPMIVQLYDDLENVWPSPVVRLNRAVAVGMADSPEAGLAVLEDLEDDPALRSYHYLPSTRADLLRRMGRREEAAEAYRRALVLVGNDVERRFLQRRLAEVTI
jgi:RNA polymerase sigma-70 factor (ECF subfamily)